MQLICHKPGKTLALSPWKTSEGLSQSLLCLPQEYLLLSQQILGREDGVVVVEQMQTSASKPGGIQDSWRNSHGACQQ